ncbi:MAG: hypothetical protein K0S74_935 [Chlamydiales bacterium]|jgi:hypothetical protein|nr:hypothetical protein [Chlamydiales bacterium]
MYKQAFFITFLLLVVSVGLAYNYYRRELCFESYSVKELHYYQKNPVALVSYADGAPVYFYNQAYLGRSAIGKGVDLVWSCSSKDLDSEFKTTYAQILSQKRGAGYWLWKPYLILKMMKMMPENALIIYIDAGTAILRDLTPLLELADKKELIFFENYHTNASYIKRDCYILMDCDDQDYYEAAQLDAAFMLFKNTAKSRAFVQKWFEYCQNEQILTDKKSVLGTELTTFIDHRHDQAILSLLRQKEGIGKVIAFPQADYFFFHHRRSRSNKDHLDKELHKRLRQPVEPPLLD